jgi:hypothetical protein
MKIEPGGSSATNLDTNPPLLQPGIDSFTLSSTGIVTKYVSLDLAAVGSWVSPVSFCTVSSVRPKRSSPERIPAACNCSQQSERCTRCRTSRSASAGGNPIGGGGGGGSRRGAHASSACSGGSAGEAVSALSAMRKRRKHRAPPRFIVGQRGACEERAATLTTVWSEQGAPPRFLTDEGAVTLGACPTPRTPDRPSHRLGYGQHIGFVGIYPLVSVMYETPRAAPKSETRAVYAYDRLR